MRRCTRIGPGAWLHHIIFTRSRRKNLTRITGTEIILFKYNQTSWIIGKAMHYTWNTAPRACTGIRKIPFRTGNLRLYPPKPHHEPFPFKSSKQIGEIRRKYLKQTAGYTRSQTVHVKVVPLPVGADLPHTCYHCLKFEHFPACLVSETGLHRAPAGEKPAFSFRKKMLWNLLLWQEKRGESSWNRLLQDVR